MDSSAVHSAVLLCQEEECAGRPACHKDTWQRRRRPAGQKTVYGMRGAGWEKSRKHVRGAEQGGGEQMKERVEARGLAVEWMVLRWHSARVPAAAVAEHRQCCAIMSTRVPAGARSSVHRVHLAVHLRPLLRPLLPAAHIGGRQQHAHGMRAVQCAHREVCPLHEECAQAAAAAVWPCDDMACQAGALTARGPAPA